MKKTMILIISLITALVMISSVSAWHCSDTDEAQPPANSSGRYGTWGDNAQLGGVNLGWPDYPIYHNQVVPQGCVLTGDSNNPYECYDTCIGNDLREFVCTDRPDYNGKSYPGETIISWVTHKNSPECMQNNVPEFSIVGAVALIGLLGLFVLKKRN